MKEKMKEREGEYIWRSWGLFGERLKPCAKLR